VASRNDQLMIASGTKKRAFGWQSKMGVCNSYRTALKRNYELSVGYDKIAISWKEEHEKEYTDMLKLDINPNDRAAVDNYRKMIKSTPPHYQVIHTKGYYNIWNIYYLFLSKI